MKLIYYKVDNRTRYYKCYDGKRPITAHKGDATRMDENMAGKVLSQLESLGYPGWKIMDESARPE